MLNKRHWPRVLLLAMLILLVSACGNAANASSASGGSAPATFTFVYQPGLGAVTFITLKIQNTLHKQFPNTNFQWKSVNSGAAVRNAVIAHQGDLGSLGIPPFLVGWDKGVNWKVLLATSRSDAWLVAMNPKFKSLRDFGPNDKIGVVAPDSQQAILLRKAAQEQLGNAHALDANLVTIASATGEQALLTGHLAAQLSGAPYQNQEVAAGGHIVLHTTDVFGPVGAGVIVLQQSLYSQYPAFSKQIYQDFVDVTAWVNGHRAQAAQYLASNTASAGGGTAAQFETLLADPTIVYDKTPSGLLAYATFMQSIGLITKAPKSVNDLELPTVIGTGS
ncbi:MAG TPA: ABC transporter substrate-binding protein [Ktedonobacteraceae bacterium]|jgi:NitT/TauT family transport system substrate-binding protein